MKTTSFDGAIQVKIGEVFAVARPGLETSGYRTEIDVPPGIATVGIKRNLPEGIGGAAQVIECFRCDQSGNYQIVMRQQRPWDAAQSVASVLTVHCRQS